MGSDSLSLDPDESTPPAKFVPDASQFSPHAALRHRLCYLGATVEMYRRWSVSAPSPITNISAHEIRIVGSCIDAGSWRLRQSSGRENGAAHHHDAGGGYGGRRSLYRTVGELYRR